MSDAPRFDACGDEWTRHGGRTPFRFDHDLADEPLFTLPALASLADRLPPGQVETSAADHPVVVDERNTAWIDEVADAEVAGITPVGRRSPGDVVLAVEAERRWFALHNVETDLSYRHLVEDLFLRFRWGTGGRRRDLYRPEGYVFISSTGATTPSHVDHEHNLFFQVRGQKAFTTGTFPDAATEHRTFEGMYGGEYGHTSFEPAGAVTHQLGGGDGLYVPPPAVHHVRSGAGLSISFSLVFHDRALDRIAKVYACNGHLRALHLRPRPPGASRSADVGKAALVWGWRGSRRIAERAGRVSPGGAPTDR